MKVGGALLLGSCLAIFSSSIARAEPVTFQFAGSVTEGFGALELFGAGSIGPGTPFSGTFTYDPATAFFPPEFGDTFILVDPPAAMTIRLGTFTATTTEGVGFRPDSGVVFGRRFNEPLLPPGQTFAVSLGLGNPFPHAAPTAETLAGAFDPTRGTFRLSLSEVDEDPHAELSGQLRSFTVASDVAPIPEPGTLVLVGSGVLLTAVRKRRRLRSLTR